MEKKIEKKKKVKRGKVLGNVSGWAFLSKFVQEALNPSLPPDITKLSVVSEYCQSVLVLKTAKITLVGWAICRERKRGERKKKKWKMGNQE